MSVYINNIQTSSTCILFKHNMMLFKHIQVVYKLTDFGYAKSYDQSSVCTSLVGTMQYVVSYSLDHFILS